MEAYTGAKLQLKREKPMITVYGTANTRSTRVTWMLEEVGATYEFSAIDFSKGDNKAPAFLAINPAGKIPVLTDNDLALTESAAIINYLADKFPDSKMIPPAGSPERGHYDRWCFFAMAELEQPLWTMGKNRFALPEEHRVTEILPTAAWEFQQALILLSEGLADKDYILGDQFSGADILLSHTINWGVVFKQPVEQTNLSDYRERCMQRPALAQAKQREKSGQ
jgi:glutathione S-transferase